MSQFAGAPGIIGSDTVGVASGGGTFYDVPGTLAPSFSEAGQDPAHPVPATKLPEPSGGTSWSDVFKTLAAGAGELAIRKLFGAPGQNENREVKTNGKGNLASAPEVLPRYDSTPRDPSGPSNSGGMSSTGTLLLVGAVLVVAGFVFMRK